MVHDLPLSLHLQFLDLPSDAQDDSTGVCVCVCVCVCRVLYRGEGGKGDYPSSSS